MSYEDDLSTGYRARSVGTDLLAFAITALLLVGATLASTLGETDVESPDPRVGMHAMVLNVTPNGGHR